MNSPATTTDELAAANRPTYVDEAAGGEYRWWRYVLGLVIIVVANLVVGGAVGLLVVYAVTGGLDPATLGPTASFVAIMSGFPFFLAGIVLVVTRLHRRHVRTLVTARARIDWRRVGLGFLTWLVLLCLVKLGSFLLAPESFSVNTDLAALALFAPLAIALTAIQTTTEELFFRGYVVQAASRVWGNRVFLALVSATLFTLPHLLNPEAAAGGWLTVFFGYFVGTGLVWVVVSLIDGTTELAIGAHFANNITSILLVGTAGTVVTTPALFTVDEYDPTVGALSTLIIVPLFMVTVLWFFKRNDVTEPSVPEPHEVSR